MAKRKGAPRLWTPTRACLERQQRGADRFTFLQDKYSTATSLNTRLEADYFDWCALNNSPPADPISLQGMINDMLAGPLRQGAKGLKLSTVREYCIKLKSIPQVKSCAFMRSKMKFISNIVATAAADEEIQHAVDIDHADCLRIFKCIPPGRTKAHLAMIALCGARAKDVSFLRPAQISIPVNLTTGMIHVQVRIAKNRKRAGKRVNLVLPPNWRFGLAPLGAVARSYLANQPPDSQSFLGTPVAILNAALASACAVAKVTCITTYSLRRLFVHEMIRLCKRDFEKVQRYTLHFCPDTLRANYDKWGGV